MLGFFESIAHAVSHGILSIAQSMFKPPASGTAKPECNPCVVGSHQGGIQQNSCGPLLATITLSRTQVSRRAVLRDLNSCWKLRNRKALTDKEREQEVSALKEDRRPRLALVKSSSLLRTLVGHLG